MSGIELIQILEKIKNKELSPEERLASIKSLVKFDPNILSPNVDPLLNVLKVLAERIIAGENSEINIFGAYLVQLCRLSSLMQKHINRINNSIKKLFNKYPKLLEISFVFVAVLAGSKYLIEAEPTLIFNDFIKSIIIKGLKISSQKIRLRALYTLFSGLWALPWALNQYLDVIKDLLDEKETYLWRKLFEYLGILGKKNFYALRSLLDYVLKIYPDVKSMPKEIIFFLADLKIPLREEEYILRVSRLLKDAILAYSDGEIKSKAIVGLANIFRHPKFVAEKKELLELMRVIIDGDINFDVAIAVLHALAIPQWYKVTVDLTILKAVLDYYAKIKDFLSRRLFLDTLLLVYSNIDESSRIILEFLVKQIENIKSDIELASVLFDVISSIIKSEFRKDNIRFLLKSAINLLLKPVTDFSIAMRTIVIENILLPIAIVAPDIFVEFAEDLERIHKTYRNYAVYDSLSKTIFEALRRYNQVNQKALILLDILFDSPNLEASYDTLLEYLVGLAKKYSIGVLKHIATLVEIYKIIRKLAPKINDPREKYFVVDKALKDLIRVIGLVLPMAPAKLLIYLVKLLVAIFVGESGSPVMDALFVMKQARDIPQFYNVLLAELKALKDIPEEKMQLLVSAGIIEKT